MNLITLTDSYKFSHWQCYPQGTQKIFSYLEARGGEYPETLFFGLQYYLKEYLDAGICLADIKEAKEWAAFHGVPFNEKGWLDLLNKHGFADLPLEINAVPEGKLYPTGAVLMTIENTDERFPWLTNWMETLLMKVWYPTTVATKSYYVKQIIKGAYEKSSDSDFVDFSYHNFGDRGSSSVESAMVGGMAHLTQFSGTDNFNSVIGLEKYYGIKKGGSIPACYDSETEVLTENGFIKFTDLPVGVKVAQYGEDGIVSFVIPSSVYNMPYSGEMVKWSKDGLNYINLLVTPNHKMVGISNITDKIKLFEAGSKRGYSSKTCLPVAGISLSSQNRLAAIDKLRIAFQADGSFPARAAAYKSGQIRFNIKKERKVNRLTDILNEVGVKYSKTKLANGYHDFWIVTNEVFTKDFSWVNLENYQEWFDEFIAELQYWDGTKKSNCIIYSSINKDCVDRVQAVCALSGHKTHYSSQQDKRENRQLLHTVTIQKKSTVVGERIKKELVNYNGTVHCVSVPSKMLIVRRNNVVNICGNTEHSTITSWGRENELQAIEHWLEINKGSPIIACVMDSYDIYKAVDYVTTTLKDKIESPEYPIFVIRPDSGEPVPVLTKILFLMEENKVGFKVNSKGFKVFDKYRIIWGDGITPKQILVILNFVISQGYSAENIAFGSGGDLMQNLNRDTCKFAIKCSAAKINGDYVDVFKDPITDHGKKSKAGVLTSPELQTVFLNGTVYERGI